MHETHNGPTKNEHPDRIRSFGPYSYGKDNINIYYWANGNYNQNREPIDECFLDVGKFCSISGHILVYMGGNHHYEEITNFPFTQIYQNVFNNPNTIKYGQPWSKGGVKIGNDCWLGTYATIHSGVTIGDGAVIASNSVVVKDVEPYSIVGGNPAKHIKYRFDEETRKKLLELKWWDMPVEHINELTPLLCSQNFDDFFKRANELKDGTNENDKWLGVNFLS